MHSQVVSVTKPLMLQPKLIENSHIFGRILHHSVCRAITQEAKYVESQPNTTSAWASWSRFDIPVDRYGRVHSLLICTSSTLGSSACHQASKQKNTYRAKYKKADRASTLRTMISIYGAKCLHSTKLLNKIYRYVAIDL